MAEFEDLLDFPPAPKLNVLGKLDQGDGDRERDKGPDAVLRKSRVRHLSCSAVLYGQSDARPNIPVMIAISVNIQP